MAWKYVPFLTIAIIFGGLSGYIGGFFTAVKNSKVFATSTMIGALTNIVLNFAFIPLFGAMGAATATAISYFVTWLFRLHQSKRYIHLEISIARDVVSYLLLVIQSVMVIFLSGTLMYFLEGISFALMCILYFPDMKLILGKVLRKQ